jgi:hemerythrin-like metal-binding protein
MAQIKVIEYNDLLRIRIEKILSQLNDAQVDVITPMTLGIRNKKLVFGDCTVLIMDIDHFEMGYESLVEEIRGIPELVNMPIILVTTAADKTLISKVVKYKAMDIITKPFTDLEFLEKVLKYKRAPMYDQIEVPSATDQLSSTLTDNKNPIVEYGLLIWNDVYKIGIEAIDLEHKSIVDQFEQLYRLMKDGKGHEHYQSLLDFLKDYIEHHFTNEEALQKEMGFSGIEAHKMLHENFKQQVLSICEMNDGKKITNHDLIKLNLFIKDWLIHHILVEDKKMKQ